MGLLKKVLLGLLAVFIVIQFIQPARNNNEQVLLTDISKLYPFPDSVRAVLKTACYDCHSNRTYYPWYVNIQPVGWMMDRHIKQGKTQLNFSEFGAYTARRRMSKLKAVENSLRDGTMPLASYTLIHRDARLVQTDKTLIIKWAQGIRDSLASKN